LALLPNWIIKIPLNTALVVAISGLAILTPPPFRPVFFLATMLLSELFQITLVFFVRYRFQPTADSFKKNKCGGFDSIVLYYRRFSDLLKYFFASGIMMIRTIEIS